MLNFENDLTEALKNLGAGGKSGAPAGATDIDKALAAEGISGDKAEFIKSIYQQESSSGKNTKTSNAGAVGGMQVIPPTFISVADKGWDINNPEHNLRAGIRYASQGFDASGGDPVLAGAYYYGGPGGMNKARQGVAVRDPRNPNAPDTLEYGRQVASRMGKAGAAPASAAPVATQAEAGWDQKAGRFLDVPKLLNDPTVGDYTKQLLASGTESVGSLFQAAGAFIAAPIANAFTGTNNYEGINPLGDRGLGVAKSIRDSMTDGGKAAMQDQIKGDLFDPSTWETPDTTGGWLMAGMNALGSLGGVVVTGLATGGASLAAQASRLGQAAQAARAAGNVAQAAELAAKAERLSRMATLYGAGIGAATTAGDAAGDGTQQAREFMKDMSHEELMSIPVYAAEFGSSGDETQARRAVENSAGRWAGLLSAGPGAVGGAAASRLIADILMKRGGSALLGKVASSTAGRVGVGAAAGSVGGALEETAEKVGTNMGANIATGRDPMDNVTRDTAAEAFGGAIGGKAIGAMGGIAAPQLPPELKAVADKAAEPNSPLSKAAMAGVQTGAAQAAMQPAAPQMDPMQRLAELEAIGKDKPAQQVTDEAGNPLTVPGERGRIFTAEEKAEYDQLKALRDSTPGMTPEDRDQAQQVEASQRDEILERVTEIRELLRVPGALDGLRAEGAPTTVQKFLGDLATAASKSASPAVREQALNRAEMAAEVVGLQLQRRDNMPRSQTNEHVGPPTRADQATGMVTSTAGISSDERAEALQAIAAYRNPNLPAGTRQAALNRALEIVGRNQAPQGTPSDRQTPAVLGEIPPAPNTPEWFEAEAKRREEGAWQFRQLGYDEEADALLDEIDPLLEAAASARAGELGVDDGADADIVAPAVQQSVDQATAGLPRAPIAPEDASRPAEERTAARRKRRGQFRQLADLGFETVERDGDSFVLRNTKTGQVVALESAADAQLARMAIKDTIDAKAHTAAASPLNDRKEPTEGQIRAGNYKKSDVIEMNGVKVVIENPRGSVRRGVGADGKPWETEMKHHYGEIVGTEGADGDRVDVFIGSRPDSNRIFIVDQVNEDGSFDEHKVVFGATSEADARKTYLDNYEKGWTGLGSIKEMAQPDFVQWVKSRAAKKPAAESEIGTFTVTSKGKTYTLRSVAVDGMPAAADSAARGERGQRITKGQALLIKGLAGFFGKDVIFFSDAENKVNADGFIRSGDNVTIYINERSGISPLAVFGHELMHLLKLDNPVAYAAIEKVVRDRVTDPRGFRADYEGKKREDAEDGDLNSAELEELISDLNGNLMGDAAFWKSVFDEIQGSAGKDAKGIIAQLQAFLQRMLDGAVAAFKGQPTFKADGFIKDADTVRAAFRAGLAQWAQGQGITKAAMQGELLRAEKKLGDVNKSTPRPTDGLTVTGYHFSKQPRALLTTGFFGTGLQGSDREQIMAHPDRRLRERLSFYANKGTGVRPESGVGGIAHKAELTNIYDSDADMKRLKEGRDRRGFESAVINAGYSGYLARLDGSQPAQVILLGRQSIKSEVLGPRTQIDDAPMVPAKQQRPMNLGDKILANKALPAGKMPPQTWAKILMATMPEEAAQLMDVGALGTKDVYKDELVRMIREAGGDIKKSAARAKSEFVEVEAKYKDTDQWLKAPNGAKTNLSQRQWVQVRTPSFKKWFGDWEAAAASGGVWTNNDVSKAVDENGEPLVVYHGTDKGGFSEFNTPGGTKRGDLGIFTTPNRWMASSYVRKGRAGAITEDKLQPLDAEIKDLGFSLPNGNRWVLSLDGGKRQSYYETEEAAQDALESMGGEKTSGVYALFLNIRDPHESDFEGALWSGERPGQYQVRGEDGELIYSKDGRAYFDDRDDAESLAEENDGAEVEPADDHHETTDDVVKDARLYVNDGAIIRNVVDDGGGGGGYNLEPSDVFVALDPGQLKSADFNGGEFSQSADDIRRSPARDGLKQDVADAVAGIKKVAASLTKPEREKLRKDTGSKMMEIYKALPSSDEVAAVAYAGKAKRGWYRHSVEAIQHIFGDEGWRFAALLAATSPQTSVEVNLENTLNTWKNWNAAGRPTSKEEIVAIMGRSVQGTKGEDSVLGAWINNSVRALSAKEFSDVVLSGPKVDSFMRNLNGNYQEVTNDAWIANYALVDQTLFSGSANKAGTEPGKGAGYLAMSAKTREAAKKLGWEPAEVQETVWSWAMSMLETMDRAGESRGAIQLLKEGALTDEVINATPDFRTLFHAPRYAKILQAAGYANQLDSLTAPLKDEDSGSVPFDAAKMDRLLTDAGLRLEFLQRQRRTNVQVSWEARPGESTGILPGMHSARLELQEQYLADIFTAIEGSGFLEKTGFSLRNTIFGPSAWEGKVLAGAQTLSRPGVVADNKGSLRVDQETRRKLETVASVLGLVLNQEGVYWHYPVYKTGNPSTENGIEINFGRSLTNAEMNRLYKAISRKAGNTEWAPANTPSGVRILNYTDTPNKEFHRKVKSALNSFARTIDADGELKTFSADGDAISNNWKENPDGQDYRQRISQAKRPDLLEWIDGSLQPAIDAVNKRYSEQYGWGSPGRSEARAVQDAGGIRRSPGRVSLEGGSPEGIGREEDGSLSGLPRDFNVAGVEIRASHWAPAAQVAKAYMESRGLEYRPPSKYVKVDKERAARIAAEYDRMRHDPKNPVVQAAFQALADETIAQYRAVMETGLEVEFIDFAKQGDPYAASPRLATEDVRNNNHFWVFSTRDGYGTAEFDVADNPMLAETEFVISGQKALVNDLFRVVHDYFGHVKEGLGFRADGEENAWRAHSAMFTPLAQRALTTETRGQNSWVNYGPHGEKNRKASAGETHYADQKTGLMPLWVSEEGRTDDVKRSPARDQDDDVVVTIGDEPKRQAAPEVTKSDVSPADAKGRSVSYEVTVEDTGDTARMTVDAGEALADYDDRIDTMKKLLECLNK